MRAAHIILGVLMVGAAAALVAGGSRLAAPPAGDVAIDAPDPIDVQPDSSPYPALAEAQSSTGKTATPPARTIDPETIAPPAAAITEIERVAPRPPLSTMALAHPPQPKPPEDLKDEPLYQPVATAAGVIKAKGHTITVSGVDVVKPGETCTDSAGKAWKCGLRARTAFRAFLRGRAVSCAAPPKGGSDPVAADCKVGGQDIGAWLVKNGWARSLDGGPYAEAGDAARKARKGIFGAAPDLSGLPPPPPPVEITTPEPSSILDLSGTSATPMDEPSMLQVFPPAPAR